MLYLLTQDFGRVTAVAKGARRASHQARHHCQPLRAIQLTAKGRGQLLTVYNIDTGPSYKIKTNRFKYGLYLNELIMKLLHEHDECSGIYHAYNKAIQALAECTVIAPALRIFEKTLLKELGYGIDFHKEAGTEYSIQPQSYYRFFVSIGFKKTNSTVLSHTSHTFLGKHLINIAQDHYPDGTTCRIADSIMSATINQILFGKGLTSKKWLFASS